MLQMNLAGLEFEHINTQIEAQKARIKISNQDIANQQQQIANSQEVVDFLRNKYTNDDLYGYLETTTRRTLFQTYNLAYDLAKKAELAFRFERRLTAAQKATNFISFGYYNAARDGLQSSQQLYLALKQMEAAYQAERGHDYEITKWVSLRLLNPYALLQLRETGVCTFDVPEVAFDMDFPGHYFRRLKSVSLTIPCVVGPYTGVNATLRLLKHRYRADPKAASAADYVELPPDAGPDPRFQTATVPIDAVVASTAQNDSGAFELSLKDERYLPFEGAGAVSTWQLSLPPGGSEGSAAGTGFPRPFDYASIADVVLSMRYTSCDGGESLRRAAAGSVVSWVSHVEDEARDIGLLTLVDVRAEFAAEVCITHSPTPSVQEFCSLLTSIPLTVGQAGSSSTPSAIRRRERQRHPHPRAAQPLRPPAGLRCRPRPVQGAHHGRQPHHEPAVRAGVQPGAGLQVHASRARQHRRRHQHDAVRQRASQDGVPKHIPHQ
jgi:hypothetical protein